MWVCIFKWELPKRKTKFTKKKGQTRERDGSYFFLQNMGWVENLRHPNSAHVFFVGKLLCITQRHVCGFVSFLYLRVPLFPFSTNSSPTDGTREWVKQKGEQKTLHLVSFDNILKKICLFFSYKNNFFLKLIYKYVKNY